MIQTNNEISWQTPVWAYWEFIQFARDGEWHWRLVSPQRHMDNIKRRVRNFRRQQSVALCSHCIILVNLLHLSRDSFRILLSSRSPVYLAVLLSFRGPLYSIAVIRVFLTSCHSNVTIKIRERQIKGLQTCE